MARQYFASDFAYGLNSETIPLTVSQGTTGSGAGTLTLAAAKTTIRDVVGNYDISPLATNAPVLVGVGSVAETVTPSAVSTVYPYSLTATFSNAHGGGTIVASGTIGLQEAINLASSQNGGVVVVDGRWAQLGGTTAMINAAVAGNGSNAVGIMDLRGAVAQFYTIVGSNFAAAGTQYNPLLLTTNGALPAAGGYYVITKAGVLADTLAAPTAAQNGQVLVVTSRTANAHTITATGLINNGTTGGPHNLATFAAFAGASITLVADNLLWNVLNSDNVVIS